MKIGMAGTGRMGAAIAQRLAGRGHQVTVWNRTADKARALGLDVADSATRLADVSETLISILTDAAALESVYGQLLAGD
ncbi:MAG: NAD(P)-dependent oxidoreductase, partial [Betaproteobacteria bacterium]